MGAVFYSVYEKIFSNVQELSGNISGFLFVIDHNQQVIYKKRFGSFVDLDEQLFSHSAAQTAIQLGKESILKKEEHVMSDLHSYASYGLPLYDKNKIVGSLGLIVAEEHACNYLMDFIKTLSIAITLGYQSIHSQMQNKLLNIEIQEEAHRREVLFDISNQFHSTMNVEQVLERLLSSINNLYPDMSVELYLSIDTDTSLPVKTLGVDGTDDLTLLAFRDGENKIKESDEQIDLALPLRGNQGVYGVLRLTTTSLFNFSAREREFIQFVADTAGSAFENAQLYEQSRNLIRELRLINEMAHHMNKSLKLSDVLHYILDQIKEAFHSDYCMILTFTEEEKHFKVISSSYPEHIGMTFDDQTGYLGKLYQNKQEYIITDLPMEKGGESNPYYKLFSHRSLMLVPFIQNGKVTGAIAVFDKQPNYFDYEDLKFLRLITQHTALAITNASLHLEMERLIITDNLTGLYTRKYLDEQAKESIIKHDCGSLILLDIDHFKKVNDIYGHLVGDEILLQVTQLIKDSIRHGDIAARWGGEELAIYLPNVNHEIARTIAERIRVRVMESTSPSVTISGGVSTWTKEEEQINLTHLFTQADKALYMAKNQGRNQICSYQ